MNIAEYQTRVANAFPGASGNDVDAILAFVLELPRLDLWLHRERELSNAEIAELDAKIAELADDKPLQYVLGEAPFRNLILKVGEEVLIPRPETEMMVDLGIEALAGTDSPSICDLGTGTGAVALAFADEMPESRVVGVDSSRTALEYAETNRRLNGLENVSFVLADLFTPLNGKSEETSIFGRKFDLVVANLPYVSRPLYEALPRGIRGFEPESALLAGEDGLDVIRAAAKNAPDHLKDGGTVIFEHSPEQADAMVAILAENGFAEIAVVMDLTGRKRFATGKKAEGR